MSKDRILKNMAVISAILSGISVLLGCICVIFPKSCSAFFFTDLHDLESYSLGPAMPFMFITALLPLMLSGIAVFSAISDTMKYIKGIITAVLTVAYQIVSAVIKSWFYSVSLRLCAYEGTDMVALLGGVNASIGFINWLNFFAVLLLVSASAIEIYVSKKKEN